VRTRRRAIIRKINRRILIVTGRSETAERDNERGGGEETVRPIKRKIGRRCDNPICHTSHAEHIGISIIAIAVVNVTCYDPRIIVARENVKIGKGRW